MTSPAEKAFGEQERLNRPGSSITFYGYSHENVNLEAVPRIGTALKQFLHLPHGGMKVVYLEFADLSDSIAPKVTEDANRRKLVDIYVDSVLTHRFGRIPTSWEVDSHVKRIESILVSGEIDPIKKVLSDELLRVDDLQPYFIWSEMDRQRQEVPFAVAYEHHSDIEARNLERLIARSEDVQQMVHKRWDMGDYDGSLFSFKLYRRLVSEIFTRRTKDIVGDLKTRLRKMSKTPNGGAIFALFGRTHSSDIERLQRELTEYNRISFDIRQDRKVDSPGDRIHGLQRVGLLPDDLTITQSILHEMMLQAIKVASLARNKLTVFCNNWGEVYELSAMVALSYNLNQLRDFCRRRVTFRNVLYETRDNPLTVPLRDFYM